MTLWQFVVKQRILLHHCSVCGMGQMAVFSLHGQNGCFLVVNFPQSHCQKYCITLTLRWKSTASLHHVLLRFRDVRIYVSQLLFLTGWVVLNAQYPISLANKLVCLKAESLSIFIYLPRFSIFPPYWALGRQWGGSLIFLPGISSFFLFKGIFLMYPVVCLGNIKYSELIFLAIGG